uniref:Superfamily I DNA and RNA helicase and helicaseubunit n=1 Tax=Thermofilum adornatum TaxID=1365176 RepID=A0A7C1GIY8_9CREN
MSKGIDAKQHMDLALRYLEDGRSLADKDPVQASEKLYKAAEEAVKMLAISFNVEDILKTVDEMGRWTVTELEKAVSRISKKLGDWFSAAWDRANYLHVWGFHEAKLDSEAVKERIPDIERMVTETRKIIYGNND